MKLHIVIMKSTFQKFIAFIYSEIPPGAIILSKF
jgi:hypothetical protein